MRKEDLDRIANEIEQMRASLAAMKAQNAGTVQLGRELASLRDDLGRLRDANPHPAESESPTASMG